jgi:hypothetical protein
MTVERGMRGWRVWMSWVRARWKGEWQQSSPGCERRSARRRSWSWPWQWTGWVGGLVSQD